MIEIREDQWFSSILGYGVFRIDVEPQAGTDRGAGLAILDVIRRHADQQPVALYYTKIPTNRVETARQLSSAGLYVVEVNIILGIETNFLPVPSKPRTPSECAVREIWPDEHEGVLDIAGSCFRYSRFHLDPLIPNQVANRLRREWIQSYIRKERGEGLFVALIEGRPVGFLAVLASEDDGKRVHTIELMGVAMPFQNRGVGQALVAFFIDRYKEQSDQLRVGTQVANVPSIRLYEKCGFSILKSAYVLHMHVRQGDHGA